MGFSVPSLQTIISDIQGRFIAAYGTDLDVSPDTPDGQLINNISEAIYQVYQAAQGVYDNSKAYMAQGQALEDLYALNNIYKKTGYKSICQGVLLGGTAGTVIPANSVAQTTSGNKFYSSFDVTLDDTGHATVDFISEVEGPIVCAAGQLNTISTPVTGWTTVNNPSDALVGSLGMTDTQFRAVFLGLIGQYAMGYVGNIQSLIKAVNGVNDCFVYNNPGPGTAPSPWVTPASSIAVLVDYQDSTIEEAIAYAIFQGKGPIFTATLSDGTLVTKTIQDAAGTPQVIKYYRATHVPIYIAITLTETSKTGADIELAMRVLLTQYVTNNAKIGKPIIYFSIVGIVADMDPRVLIEEFFLNTTPDPTTGTEDLTPAYFQIFTLSPADITITVNTGSRKRIEKEVN